MTKEREEEQGFRVTDKRSFTEEGEVHAAETSESKEPKFEPSSTAEAKSAGPESSQRPPIDFPSYILGYYAQGSVLLGKVPNPYTNKKEEDPEAAKNIIEILAMLEQKTKGNLSKEEAQLLESVLYELRMEFMAKTNRIKI
jgi:hypothetical protein